MLKDDFTCIAIIFKHVFNFCSNFPVTDTKLQKITKYSKMFLLKCIIYKIIEMKYSLKTFITFLQFNFEHPSFFIIYFPLNDIQTSFKLKISNLL